MQHSLHYIPSLSKGIQILNSDKEGQTLPPSQPHLSTKPHRGKEPGDVLLISALSNQQPTIIEA